MMYFSSPFRTDRGAGSFPSADLYLYLFLCSRRPSMLSSGGLLREFTGRLLRRKEKQPRVTSGRLESYAQGEQLTMSFARCQCTWSEKHTPGRVLSKWERLGDAADVHMGTVQDREGLPSLDIFLERLRADKTQRIDPMPEWVDYDLLDDGMKFFVEAWPLVFVSFGWAVVGGFGCESASAVLLESRYWAGNGEAGRRDTWRRLRETACWLFEICAPGAQAFAANGSAWHAALHIRYLHARTRRSISKAHGGVGGRVGGGSSFSEQEFGVPISQLQLVGTLLGSSVLLLQGMERAMGMPLRSRDKEGFVHLWRVVGHLFGIDEDKNPNTCYSDASVMMESVFLFAIPESPRPALTHALTSHIYQAVSEGMRAEHGLPVSEALLASQARLYLGDEYAHSIGLPPVAWYHTLLSVCRLLVFRTCYAPYFLLHGWDEARSSRTGFVGATLHAYVVRPVYRLVMRRSFAALVKDVRARQPGCRFAEKLC